MGCDNSSGSSGMKMGKKHDICIEYFPFFGRAEPTKMMLAYYGVPFTCKDVMPADWAALKCDKKQYPFGGLPLVSVDGCRLGCARPQMRFLA